MAPRRKIHFFTDNDVPNSVGEAISAMGHQLTRLRDVMLDSSPDEIVASACRDRRLVLVTHNVRDFRRIVREQLAESKAAVGALHRIELECDQARAAQRFAEEMPHILADWARFEADPACELRVTIGNHFVRLNRDWTGRATKGPPAASPP
jgi:hypothetical protein